VDWFAYGHARNTEKGARETFGKGDIRGVIGVDAAQNAQVGGSLVPTLFLGVPGNVTMSMLLVVFVIQGLQPGPEMVTTHLDLTMVMIWSLVFANVLAAGFCLAFSAQFAKIALVPAHIVAPLVVVIMAFAAVNASRSVGDLVALLAIGTLGWIMKRLHWPRPPLLIAFVLGPIIEQYLFISTNRYGMGWLLHPGVIAIGLCMALVFLFEVRNARRARAERAVRA
jgi:TctA family transporter